MDTVRIIHAVSESEHSLLEKYRNVGKEEQIALEAKLDDLKMQKRARAVKIRRFANILIP
jgi:hypothetical protein